MSLKFSRDRSPPGYLTKLNSACGASTANIGGLTTVAFQFATTPAVLPDISGPMGWLQTPPAQLRRWPRRWRGRCPSAPRRPPCGPYRRQTPGYGAEDGRCRFEPSLGKDGDDGFREALEPVDDGDENVLYARVFNSFITRSQNLAPSFCSSHRPRISLVPSARTPSATYTALLRTSPSSRILTRKASKKTKG